MNNYKLYISARNIASHFESMEESETSIIAEGENVKILIKKEDSCPHLFVYSFEHMIENAFNIICAADLEEVTSEYVHNMLNGEYDDYDYELELRQDAEEREADLAYGVTEFLNIIQDEPYDTTYPDEVLRNTMEKLFPVLEELGFSIVYPTAEGV